MTYSGDLLSDLQSLTDRVLLRSRAENPIPFRECAYCEAEVPETELKPCRECGALACKFCRNDAFVLSGDCYFVSQIDPYDAEVEGLLIAGGQ